MNDRHDAARLDSPIAGVAPTLRIASALVLLTSLVGAIVGGNFGTVAAGISVAVIVAVPLLRVAALGVHWWSVGDRRFAIIAAALLVVVGSGAIIAAL
ncbi:MAG: hypothetical protein HY826_08910 [Actinobacteria bacterium]|nr:hypothetical protein [Actinomycetota bacterium]